MENKNEKMEIIEEKKSGAWKVLLAIFLTLIIAGGGAGAGVFFWQQTEIDSQRTEKQKMTQEKEELNGKVTDLEGKVSTYKKEKEADEKKVSELKKGTIHFRGYIGPITCLGDPSVNGVVSSEKSENVSYYASSTSTTTTEVGDGQCVAYDSGEKVDVKKSHTQVFKHNKSTGKTERIYSEQREGKAYHLIGIEGDKLIFVDWNTDVDYSPGVCTNKWAEGDHYYLDVNDVESGMQEYTVPDGEVLKGEKALVKKCAEEMESETVN